MENPNSLVTEYIELWNQVLAKKDNFLPHVVEAGLATSREKIGVDTLDYIVNRQDTVYELRKELKSLDESYNSLIAEVKKNKQDLRGGIDFDAKDVPQNDQCTRVVDFLFGILTSLNRDFSKSPELEYFAQQFYLFASQNTG